MAVIAVPSGYTNTCSPVQEAPDSRKVAGLYAKVASCYTLGCSSTVKSAVEQTLGKLGWVPKREVWERGQDYGMGIIVLCRSWFELTVCRVADVLLQPLFQEGLVNQVLNEILVELGLLKV